MKHLSALLTLIAAVAFLASPLFTDPFTGYRPDQLPIPQPDPPIQPAGYAFSIWGVIYAWLLVSAVFGLWKRAGDPAWDRVRWPLIASLTLGAPWLAVANTSPIWATVLIFAMLATAIIALIRAPVQDRWWLQAPVALYAGWLTAASFVSLGATMAGYGIAFDATGWAYAGIAGALAVGLGVLRVAPRAPEYATTLIWALVGIMVKNGMALPGVTGLAALGIVVLVGAALLCTRRMATA